MSKNECFSESEILETEENFTKLSEILAKNARNGGKIEQK